MQSHFLTKSTSTDVKLGAIGVHTRSLSVKYFCFYEMYGEEVLLDVSCEVCFFFMLDDSGLDKTRSDPKSVESGSVLVFQIRSSLDRVRVW